MLRRIFQKNSDDEESDSGDTDSDASNLDFIGKGPLNPEKDRENYRKLFI